MTNKRISPHTYQRIVLVALVLLTLIIITGGAVRVTGSGLGCPDWPKCYEDRFAAELEGHGLIEFGNRLLTGVVGAAVIVGVLGSLLRQPRRTDLTLLSLSLVLGVIAQAILGGISVLVELHPLAIAGHFLLSMLILWSALVLYRRAKQPDGQPHAIVHRDYVWLGRAMMVLTAAVLVAGTVVTGSGPHGGDPDAQRFGFEPRDVTQVHGALVWTLLVVTALTVWRLYKAQADRSLIHKGEVAMAAMVAQGAIGYIQYATGVPAGLVLVHIAGATLVWIAVVWFNLSFHERWEPVGVVAYDGPPEEADSATEPDPATERVSETESDSKQ
jgi:heme a synthase